MRLLESQLQSKFQDFLAAICISAYSSLIRKLCGCQWDLGRQLKKRHFYLLVNPQLSLKTQPQAPAKRFYTSKIIFSFYVIDEVQEQSDVSSSKIRTRTKLTDYQKQMLERVFASTPYLTSTQQTEVASGVGITKQVLQVCNFLFMPNA